MKRQASQAALVVKNTCPSAGDTSSVSGSGRRALGEGVTTHSSILAWRIPWTEGPGGLKSIGFQGSKSGEGNSNPLQYFCLGNLRDRGAWEAAVHGVAKSRT